MYSSFPGGPPGGAPQANSHLPFGAIAPGTGTGVSPTSNQGFNPAPHQLQHTPTFPQQPFGSQQQPYQQLQQASSFSQLPPPQQQQQYYQQGPPPPPPPPPPTSPPRQQHQWGAPQQQQQPLQSGGYNPAAPPPPGPQGNSGLGYNPNGLPLIHQQYIGSHNYGTHATGQPAPPPPSLPYQQHQNQSHAPPPPPPPPPPTTSQHQPVYQYHQQQQQPSAPPPPPPPPPPTQYGSSHGRWDSNVTQQYQSQQPQAPPRPTDFYSQGPSTTSPANSYPPASGGGDGTYNQKPHQFNHLQQQQSYSSTPPPPQAQQIQTPPISQPTPSSTFPADGVYGRINQAVSTPTPPPPPVASAPAKDYPYTQSTSSTIDYPYTQATTAKWSQSEQQSRPTAQFQPQLTQQIYTSATATPPPGSPLKNVFQGQQESRPTPPPPAQPPAQSGASASTSNYHYPPANLISQSEQQNRPTPPPLPQFQQQFSQQIHTAVSSTTPPPAAGPIFQSESQNRPTPPPTLPQFQPQPSQQIYTDATYVHPHPPEVKPIFQTETQSRPTPPPLPQFQPQPSPQVYTKPTATPPPPPQPLSQAQIPIPPPKPATPAAQEPQTHLGSGLTSASVFASGPLDNWDQFGGYYQTEEPTPVQSEPNVQNAPADLTHHHHQEHKPVGDANDVAQVNVHQRAEKGLPLGYQAPTVESVPAIPPNTTAQYQMDVGYINSAQAPATQHDQSVYKPDTSAVVPPPATVQQPPVTEPLVYTEPVQAAPQSAPDSHLLDGAVRQEQQSEEDATIERLQELDPFYQESISRFIVMIEAEAAAETDEEKLKIFKEFMEQEYFVRGQRYPLAIGEPPSRQGSITDRIYAAAAPRNQADSETQASAGVHQQQQQPVQAEPVVYHEPVQAVHQDPVKTEPVVYHEPVGAEPVYHQPVNEPGPASAPPPHQEPVQTEPVYHQPVQSEPVYQDPTRATSPVSSVSTAPYKPFRPTTPQASSSTETKYVPFSPPQPLYHKPNSPKPSPSPPNAQKPAYVPYKPTTFVSRSPRRKSFSEYDEVPPTSDGNQNPSEKYAPFRPGVVSGSNRPQSTIGFGPRRAGTSIEGMGAGYDEVPSSDGNHKPGEGYAPFRPGAVPGSNRPQSTIEPFRPGAISGSNRPQSTIEIRPEFGPPRRAGTSIEGMGIHGMAPMPFRRDETFLPVSEKASDDFFPSVGDDEVSEEEPETPIPATAPLVTSRMITVGLTRLLPPKGAKREKSPVLEEMKKKVTEIGEDFSFIDAAVQAFEKSEAPKRKKLEDDRKTRQDEHQDFVDGLFADNQIGYGDIGAMDDEFAKKEEKIRKADETAEYSRYVKEVFEPVYNKLQEGIKEVMDMHFKASGELLAIAVTGRDRWIADGRPELESVLQMLVRIDGIVERRHAKVHEAILARDRKFRRTVTEPLRVRNDLKKVMNMIKHFDESEKRLMIDAARQKLSRTQALTSMIERYVGVGLERDTAYIDAITKEINNILSQLPGPPSEYKGDQVHLKEELSRAHATLKSCLQTAENLMKVHHVTLLVGNAARHELEIAEKGETAEGEEQARKEDEIVDCELKERIDTWNSEKGVVIGNLEMVLDGLKHAKATTGSSSPRQIEMGRRSRAGSRAATPVGVTPLNIGRLSPRPHSRQGSLSSVGPMSPLSPSGLPGPAQQLSALERAKLRNQGGNVIPYT